MNEIVDNEVVDANTRETGQRRGAGARSWLRRVAAALATTAFVVACVAVAIGASALLAERNAVAAKSDSPPALDVRVETLDVRPHYQLPVDLIGRVEAARDIRLGFEDAGVLDRVEVEEGERVSRGQVVARLDTERLLAERDARRAERDALDAERELAALNTERQQRLLDERHASRQGFDEARLGLARLEAELVRASAAIRSLDIALERRVLVAPFEAVVGRVLQDDGTRLGAGEPVLHLFEHATPRVRVGLPSDAAHTMSPGGRFDIDIDGETHKATLSHVRRDLDPITRTRDAVFTLPPDVDVVEGAVGRLHWERRVDTAGAWVEVSALREGIRGLWTLQFVDANDRLQSESVTLEYADARRAFVSGALPEGARYVTEGTHRTTDGQTVVAHRAE